MPRLGSEKFRAPIYVVKDTTTVDLPPQYLLFELLLRFIATYTMTGGTGAGGVQSDAAWRLFKRIAILTNNIPIMLVRGMTLRIMEKFHERAALTQTVPTSVAAAASQAIALEMALPTHLQGVTDKQKFDFLLPLFALGNPQFLVEYDDVVQMFTGAIDGVPSVSTGAAPQLWAKPVEGASFDPDDYSPVLMNFVEIFPVAAGSTVPIDLKFLQPGHEIVRVYIEAFNGNATRLVYDDTLVTQVALNVNGQWKHNITDWAVDQNRNKKFYQLSAKEAGVVCIDACEDRDASLGALWKIDPGPAPFIQIANIAPTNLAAVRVTVVYTDRTDKYAKAA